MENIIHTADTADKIIRLATLLAIVDMSVLAKKKIQNTK